jgi:hypothetical protein
LNIILQRAATRDAILQAPPLFGWFLTVALCCCSSRLLSALSSDTAAHFKAMDDNDNIRSSERIKNRKRRLDSPPAAAAPASSPAAAPAAAPVLTLPPPPSSSRSRSPSVSTEEESDDEDVTTDDGKFELVRKLFLDESFPGSFSGIRNMQRQIFLAKHIHIPINIIARALRSIPSYVMHLSPVRKFPTGHFEATTLGQNVQGTYSALPSRYCLFFYASFKFQVTWLICMSPMASSIYPLLLICSPDESG